MVGGGGGPLPGRPFAIKDDAELFDELTELCELLSEPLRVKLLFSVADGP